MLGNKAVNNPNKKCRSKKYIENWMENKFLSLMSKYKQVDYGDKSNPIKDHVHLLADSQYFE